MSSNTKKTESAGGVILNSKGEVALVLNGKGAFWGFPKGHLDASEDAMTAARREIEEETGLTELKFIEQLPIYARFKGTPTGGDDTSELKTMHMFLFSTKQTKLQSQDSANPEARWFPLDRVRDALIHPKDKEYFDSIKAEIIGRSFIKNRRGQNIAVVVRIAEPQKGLAFVMHGLGGFKEQMHVKAIAEAFNERGFTTVIFDTTNTFGESEGTYEDATTTNYYTDLEDVIEWSKERAWFQKPFAISGHSLGGVCAILYAEKYPEDVLAIASISPVVSGKLSLDAHERHDPKYVSRWRETGWKEEKSESIPGLTKRLKWAHVEDRLKYNVLPEAKKLTMPVLLVVGELDVSTPPDHVKMLFDVLPGRKEFHIVKGAPHNFRKPEELRELKEIIAKWIDSL